MKNKIENKGNNSPGPALGDGTLFVGINPETNMPIYTTPTDFGVTMTFNEASKFAATDTSFNHNDWRLPTDVELQMLSDAKEAIGNFDTSGSDETGFYWSSTEKNWLRDGTALTAVAQRFGEVARRFSFRKTHPADTKQYPLLKTDKASVRLVRG